MAQTLSPVNTQDLMDAMETHMLQVSVHFEGRDVSVEVPASVSDEQLKRMLQDEVVLLTTGQQCDTADILLFSVSGGGCGDGGCPGMKKSPLSGSGVREAVSHDGMILAARRGCGSGNGGPGGGDPDGGLLKGGGMRLTVDVTPSCSILLNGGVDYDLPTALAELVDNAIAALDPPVRDLKLPMRCARRRDWNTYGHYVARALI